MKNAIVLFDNDVIHKTCSYDIHVDVLTSLRELNRIATILESAIHVLRGWSRRRLSEPERSVMNERFAEFVDQSNVLEPTQEETQLAARIEDISIQNSLNLDTGESLLIAVFLKRNVEFIATGDKRAVVSLSSLTSHWGSITNKRFYVACLEQIVKYILTTSNLNKVRSSVCSNLDADRAITICFSCYSDEVSLEGVVGNLDVYINDLRSNAPETLVDDSLFNS